MAQTETQISAFVSMGTRELLEKHARATGQKKAHVVEMALLHHLQALRELPADVIIPPRLVLSKEGGRRLLRRLARPGRPNRRMRELMRG
jgi:hypothetical protein